MPENIIKKDDENINSLIGELEKYYKKPIILLVYNPLQEKGITPLDEIFFEFFKENVLEKEKIKDCILILNGFGGDLKTALLISSIFRNCMDYYSCFVPSSAGSSLNYFVLQANKLIISKNSALTQIDPLIEHQGESLRAIRNLGNLDNETRRKSHEAFDYNINILKKYLKRKES